MKRVSGVLSEIRPSSEAVRDAEVITYRVGDVVWLPYQKLYALIVAITPQDGSAHCVIRLGFPEDKFQQLQRWGSANPDKVKKLVIGHSQPHRNQL